MSSNQVAIMAERLSIEPSELQNIVIKTIMPQGKNAKPVTNEQFVSFLAVANEYALNPMVKEIYAFPTKGGGIQPIVSIDGWLKIINTDPQFNGMEFNDQIESGKLFSVTCRMFRKDRDHPVEVTEYMSECMGDEKDRFGNLTPWGRWPARMLRHKATIQAARYAFGFSGIVDPDEAERIQSSEIKDMGSADVVKPVLEDYPSELFEQNFPKWQMAVELGRITPEQVIAKAGEKGTLSPEQTKAIEAISQTGETYDNA